MKLDEAEVKRSRALLKEGCLSQDEFDQAENKLAVAQATLERANAAIYSAQYFIDQCIITSPINGIVLKKYHEIGDNINYGGQIEAGAGVFDIAQFADTEDMRAEVDINESDISRISMGTPASVIPDSYPDQSFDARVVKIYPAADRQKGTVKVEVHLLKPDLTIIKPEMSVKVTFLAGPPKQQTSPLVVVPKKAVVGEGKDTTVWTVKDDRVTKVPVVLGTRVPGRLRGQAGPRGRRDGDRGAADDPPERPGGDADGNLALAKRLSQKVQMLPFGIVHMMTLSGWTTARRRGLRGRSAAADRSSRRC